MNEKKEEGERENLPRMLSYYRDEERNTTDREGYYVVIFHKLLLKLLEECSPSRIKELWYRMRVFFGIDAREYRVHLASDTKKDFGWQNRF